MTTEISRDDPSEIDKWTRDYYRIQDESTDAFLIRNGFLDDTPAGLVKRLYMGLAWIEPQVTAHTRPLIDEIKSILARYEQGRLVETAEHWQPGKTLHLPLHESPACVVLPPPLTEVDTLQLKKGETLFEQARTLHRLQPTLDAQQQFKEAQSKKASIPRKLSEAACVNIAKHYWDSKRDGTAYGVVKMLANRYEVSTTTINAVVRKYKPASIDK
ncbi:hypothetical protein [Massilia brevitalea]|uniref:hypothetical protein n=1 Tax=Massilia brevitalea TaxID=442526 RepID=UPI00273889B2|nr:hypothetical protein [Massilia brevitalea]